MILCKTIASNILITNIDMCKRIAKLITIIMINNNIIKKIIIKTKLAMAWID